MQANKILLEILFCLFLQFSASLSVEFCPATWVGGGCQETHFFVSYAKGEAQACLNLRVLCQWQGCTAVTFAILCLARDWLYQNCPAALCRQRARRKWENLGENSHLPGWKKHREGVQGLQGCTCEEGLQVTRKGHWVERSVLLDGPPAAAQDYAQEFGGTRDRWEVPESPGYPIPPASWYGWQVGHSMVDKSA